MSEGVRAFIGIGSNIEPEQNIPAGLEILNRQAPILAISTFYRTAPIDRPEQAWYLNGVVAVQCRLDSRALKFDVLRPIEASLGRTRTADPYAARCIDLDLLLHGQVVVHFDDLVLPDPDIRRRPFLVAALLELEPEIVMPDTGELLASWADLDDHAKLERASAFTLHLRERFPK